MLPDIIWKKISKLQTLPHTIHKNELELSHCCITPKVKVFRTPKHEVALGVSLAGLSPLHTRMHMQPLSHPAASLASTDSPGVTQPWELESPADPGLLHHLSALPMLQDVCVCVCAHACVRVPAGVCVSAGGGCPWRYLVRQPWVGVVCLLISCLPGPSASGRWAHKITTAIDFYPISSAGVLWETVFPLPPYFHE